MIGNHAMRSPEGTEQPQLYCIDTGTGTRKFSGTLLSQVTSREQGSVRWTELSLYRTADGTGRYIFQSVGRSLVYHAHMSACNRGIPFHYADLEPDARPCRTCHPAGNEQVVDAEIDFPAVSSHADAARVVRAVTSTGGWLSHLGNRLLRMAAQTDTDIAAVLDGIEPL